MRTSPARLALGALLFAVYALPLAWPPATVPWRPDAGLLERLFPGVPAAWTGIRLVALAGAIAALGTATRGRVVGVAAGRGVPARPAARVAAVAVAVLELAAAPVVHRLGPAAQLAWLAALAIPALLLTPWRGPRPASTPDGRGWAGPLVVVAAWLALCLARDVGSPRAMDMVDGWRAIVDVHGFAARGGNVLTDLFDPELPGLGALVLAFLGVPGFQQAGTPPALAVMQALQIAWLALAGLGVAALTRALVGGSAATVAVAAFLFAPYTRFVGMLPGPFVAGPLWLVGIALCVLVVWRRGSEAGLAALGGLAGAALTMPGLIPVAGCLTLLALWHVRTAWRTTWAGLTTFTATFLAIVIPAVPEVIRPDRMGQHFGAHGVAAMLDRALLGQLPVGAFAEARAAQVGRPLEIVAGALLAPVANPRLAIRLWGDAIFDPITGLLFAVGVVACLRAARRDATARVVLFLLLATLAPAFSSPVDIVDVVHAVGIAVPVALLAAVGFRQLGRALPARWRGDAAAALAAAACAVGGVVLFDVVNPRILGASAPRLAVEAVDPADADRVLVLDHPVRYGIDARWPYVGPIAALGGARPLGYLRWDGTPSITEMARDGRTILFWSPGLEADLHVSDAVCREHPDATLFTFEDAAGASHVLGARLGGPPWLPRRVPATARPCTTATG